MLGGAQYGGTGNVFSISTSGGTPTTLLTFSGTNGYVPYGSLTLSGSTLYGMTSQGGTKGDGNVFSISTSGEPSNLCSFNGTNGQSPYGNLTLSGSTLYGMTSQGGTKGDGNIFSVPVSGGTATSMLAFSGSNGQYPEGSLILSNSTLYGMTCTGGSYGTGNIFRINTNGTGFQNLFSFNRTDGANPLGNLTLSGSTLYGMTGGAGGDNNDGTVFKINTNGTGFQTILSFTGTNGQYPGQYPLGSLTLSGSTLFGMTSQGGANNLGTIFALNIAPAIVALSSVSSATIITGGTATLGTTVSNSPSSGYNLNYTLTAAILSGSATLGAITSSTGSLAPSASQSCTVSATSTTLGVTSISFTASDPNASDGPQTTTETLTVLGHAAPKLSVANGNNQTVIVGATGVTAGLSLSNGTLNQSGLASLDVNSLGTLVTGSTGGELVASGSTQPYTATFSTGTLGPQTQTFSMYVGDDHTLSGASAPANISTSATLTVLDHSNASLSSTATQTTQTINFGNVLRGATIPTQNFTIYNRAANTSAA